MEFMQLLDIIATFLPFLILLLIIGSLSIVGFTLYLLYAIQRLPNNTPAKFLTRKEKLNPVNRKIVMCIGDSITHGRISQNYIQILNQKLADKYEFINAGINSHLAWNVLERLPEIIECNPNFITILIGTNDVNATLSLSNKNDYIRRMKLPRDPDHEWFCETLKKILRHLKSETTAEIAVLTIPTIGESLTSPYFALTEQYSKSIIEITKELRVESLPLHEKMVNYLKDNPGKPKYSYKKERMYILRSVFHHYFLRRSWDNIAYRAGFNLHRDYLHMNSRGALMIAELIEDYIHSVR
jgi:lysophospholipase L1-like esterase